MFLPCIRDGANAVGSTITGVKIPVVAVPAAGIANPYVNGVGPHAPDIRATADMLNMLLARRGRVLFSKYDSLFDLAPVLSSDKVGMSFACRTGPLAQTIRVVMVGYPPDIAPEASDSYFYWRIETGLTGTGTVTTGPSVFVSGGAISANAADYFHGPLVQDFTVSPRQTYRFTLHQVNRIGIVSVVAYELPRAVLDTSQDSPVVDVSQIAQGRPITTATMTQLIEAAKAIYEYGPPLFTYSQQRNNNGRFSFGQKAAFEDPGANLLDGTTTHTITTLGFPINNLRAHADVSASAVTCTAWANGWDGFGHTARLRFYDQDGSHLGDLDLPSHLEDSEPFEKSWATTTFSVPVATTRINVHASWAGTTQGETEHASIRSMGMWVTPP